MFESSNYSFKVDIHELSSPNVLISVNFDKILDEKRYWEVNQHIVFSFFSPWLNYSFHGGYKERIDKFHFHVPRPRKKNNIDITMYLRQEQIPALNNLFHLFENGWNNNPEFNHIVKINKVTVNSFDYFFLDYEHGRNRR